MGFGFPMCSGAQVTVGGDSEAKHEPGMIMGYRTGDQWSLVQYVQADNNGWSKYQALVKNFATLKHYSVKKSATTDEGAPLAGIALSTVASQYFGWMTIKGYVENVYQSQTTASGEYLMLSGTTAGDLSNNKASVFNAGTMGSSSMFVVVGVSCGIVATDAYGSAVLLGCWGV